MLIPQFGLGAARPADEPMRVIVRTALDHIHQGPVTFSKISSPDRLTADLQILDFELTEQDMQDFNGSAIGKRANDQDPMAWEEF